MPDSLSSEELSQGWLACKGHGGCTAILQALTIHNVQIWVSGERRN